MKAILLMGREKADDGGADSKPACFAATGSTVAIDRLLAALRSVGISDWMAAVPASRDPWSPAWHQALNNRGIQVTQNPRYDTAPAVYSLLLALETMTRPDALLIIGEKWMYDASAIHRLTDSKYSDAASTLMPSEITSAESGWCVDDQSRLKATATPVTPNRLFSGLVKVSPQGLPSLKKITENPKWWVRPLCETVTAWARQRDVYTVV
jgi:choline kinase